MSARVPAKRPLLVHEVGETGQTVLYDEEGRRLLLLNEVGAAVWHLVDGRRTVDEIVAFVVGHLPAPRDAVGRDVADFLRTLESHGLVEWREI